MRTIKNAVIALAAWRQSHRDRRARAAAQARWCREVRALIDHAFRVLEFISGRTSNTGDYIGRVIVPGTTFSRPVKAAAKAFLSPAYDILTPARRLTSSAHRATLNNDAVLGLESARIEGLRIISRYAHRAVVAYHKVPETQRTVARLVDGKTVEEVLVGEFARLERELRTCLSTMASSAKSAVEMSRAFNEARLPTPFVEPTPIATLAPIDLDIFAPFGATHQSGSIGPANIINKPDSILVEPVRLAPDSSGHVTALQLARFYKIVADAIGTRHHPAE